MGGGPAAIDDVPATPIEAAAAAPEIAVAPVAGVRHRLPGLLGLTGARFDPGRPGVRALAAVAVVVVVIAGVLAWRSRPHAEVVPAPAVPEVGAASPSTERLVVAVAGRVHHPGLVRLPAGARVADAVEGAGGALAGTDLGLLNLARKVTDGELIVVGAAPAPAGGAGGAAAAGADGKVSLNAATTEQLDALPGVGPVTAQRIVDYREKHGGFRAVSELQQVDGIGPSRYEQLKDLVTV